MKLAFLTIFIPPGIGIALAILAFYFFRTRAKTARTLLALSIILGWSLSTEAMGRFLSTALIGQVEARGDFDPQKIDMIVVLTGGMWYAGDIGWLPTNSSYRRALVAFELQNRIDSRVPVLISGGHSEGLKHPAEAEVTLRQFDKNRAQLTPTLVETVSTDTYESALQCASIIREKGARDIILVTSEEHMLRALAAFRGRGIDPFPIPVLTIERGQWQTSDFLPSAHGVEVTARAIYEIVGIAKYLLTDRVHMDELFYSKS